MDLQLKDIEEKLSAFWQELITLQANSKHYDSPSKFGRESLGRWKDRLNSYLTENIPVEVEKFETIRYPKSIVTRDSNPFVNFDREVEAYNSYLANLVRDIQTNPDYWLSVIESSKIKIQENEQHVKGTQDLSNLHPDIYSKCYELYSKAAYAEAVERGFKVVRDKLRELTSFEKGSEAFGKGRLHIKGAAANHVDSDFNEGVKFLTMAIDFFRNEKSHTSDALIADPIRAYEYLTISSLAMRLLDNAEIRR